MKRNPHFEGVSLTAAAIQLLQAAPEPLHQNDLCGAIFDGDFGRAKRSLSSTLSAGAKKGLLKQLGDGRYAIASKEMEGQSSK